MPCLRDVGCLACVLTAGLTTTVHGDEMTSLEYSGANRVATSCADGGWVNDCPGDFDASGMDFTGTHDGTVDDVT